MYDYSLPAFIKLFNTNLDAASAKAKPVGLSDAKDAKAGTLFSS